MKRFLAKVLFLLSGREGCMFFRVLDVCVSDLSVGVFLVSVKSLEYALFVCYLFSNKRRRVLCRKNWIPQGKLLRR